MSMSIPCLRRCFDSVLESIEGDQEKLLELVAEMSEMNDLATDAWQDAHQIEDVLERIDHE